MSTPTPPTTPTKRPPVHSSIPGYRPGPILSRGQKNLLLGLLIGPIVTYGIMKLRQQQREQQEKQLEEEGRRRWYSENEHEKEVGHVGRNGGGV